jgi:phage gp45-like
MRTGTIVQTENNTTKMQSIQASGIAGELNSGVDNFQPYGFNTLHLPMDPQTGQGAEVVLSDVFGTGNSTIVASTDRRFRPKVGVAGDVMIYSNHDTQTAAHDASTARIVLTDDGTANYRLLVKLNACKVELKSDGTITVTNGNGTYQIAANGNTTLTAPTITLNGNVESTGTFKNNGVTIGSVHKHTSSAVGTDTSVPH